MAERAGEENSEIENAVRNLLSCIGRFSNQQTSRNIERPSNSPGIGQPVAASTSASPVLPVPRARPNTVQQEMQRSFPAIFSGNKARFKRKVPECQKAASSRLLELQFCLLPENTNRTPKDETVLLQAGLGRRTVNVTDDADHAEITRVLLEEYPKMRELHGGWLLSKAAGGSGQRKTTPLPQASKGYTAKILKASSGNGKNTIYVVPLQEKIDTTPLPYDAPEFQNMPKNNCMTCGTSVPLLLLPVHIESCLTDDNDVKSDVEEKEDLDEDVILMDSCPICGDKFDSETMLFHASSCGESPLQMNYAVAVTSDPVTSPEIPTWSINDDSAPGPSSAIDLTSEPLPVVNDAWKRIEAPDKAAVLYRRFLLRQKEDEPTLKMKLDLREDAEEQEERLINFYKVHKADWARPFHVRLEGDVATGEGVIRHFFSLSMHKLQSGFSKDFGNCTGTLLFEGQTDHLIPSTSKVLVQSDLFKMAGRMIGHSFLHGGPTLTGVSPAILHVLLGGSPETATIALEDVADIDIRETIQLLATEDDYCIKMADEDKKRDSELTEGQVAAVNQLALSWDLPVLTSTNQPWLLQSLLQHAVLWRTSQQIKQLRQGLQESMLLPLLEARPDVLPVVFPRQEKADCSAEMVLDHIHWPDEEELEDDNECPLAVKRLITSYLRRFVETVSEEQRKQLVKFWVGWEKPMKNMKVEIMQADHPTSSTCFLILRLPCHYTTFDEFRRHLESCIATNVHGFGLI